MLGGDAPAAVMEPVIQPVTEVVKGPEPVVIPAVVPTATEEMKPATRRTVKKQILTFDLETIPDESRMHLFGLEPLPTPSEYLGENEGPAPSELIKSTVEETKAAVSAALAKANGKKLHRKIAEACVELERKAPKPRKGVVDIFTEMIDAIDNEGAMIAAATAAQRKKMSVTPEMCKIVAMGWAVGDDPIQSLVVGQPHADGSGLITESDVLERFWMLASAAGPVCGFNVLHFDLPVIFVRSALLKIKPSRKFDLKPWGGDVVDLMKTRFPAGPSVGLGPLCQMMGIVSALPDVDGSQVETLYRENPVKLGEYVRDDVSMSKSLHRMWSGYFV